MTDLAIFNLVDNGFELLQTERPMKEPDLELDTLPVDGGLELLQKDGPMEELDID